MRKFKIMILVQNSSEPEVDDEKPYYPCRCIIDLDEVAAIKIMVKERQV